MASKAFKVAMTGDRELDRKLKLIASENGAGSVNKQMRKTTRESIKSIVRPQVLAQVPFETGFLESELTVKAIARSRRKLGSAIGFRNDLFRGETFYAGFHEFGFRLRNGGVVPGDSFLRRPLYDSEGRIRRYIIAAIRRWIGSLRR